MFFFLALFLGPAPGAGQAIRSLTLSADNDGFIFWTPPNRRMDRYYTHGLEVEAVVAWTPSWTRLLGESGHGLCGSDPRAESCVVSRVALGQKIFTPDFIFDPDPLTHDRPYAGWLYLSVGAAGVAADGEESLALELGVTGEPSLASPTHRWFHRSLDKHEPLGWEHQIPFEPAFLVRYARRRIFSTHGRSEAATLGWEPHLEATLGTLRTGASTGMTLQAGWNAPRPREWRGQGSRGFFFRFSLGIEGEMVVRDLFLDGSTFRKSVRTDREIWVGRLRGRLQMGLSRVGVEFRSTHSTREFRGQLGGHSYGTLRLFISPFHIPLKSSEKQTSGWNQ